MSHQSGGFFHVTGLRNKDSSEEHLILYQPQSALTGLLVAIHGGEIYVMLQARVEPGNSNIGQYGPTIQSTRANYLRMHGGKATDYLEYFISYASNVQPLGNLIHSDLGKRYYQKNKVHAYLQVKKLVPATGILAWVPLKILVKLALRDNFLNTDLRALLSVFDWDLFSHSSNASENRLNSDEFAFFSKVRLGQNDWQIVSLDELKHWKATAEGIVDSSNTGVWVNMFKISCTNRETKEWYQPLYCVSDRGKIILCMRKKANEFEFLLTYDLEHGISGGLTTLTSYVNYPGETNSAILEPS